MNVFDYFSSTITRNSIIDRATELEDSMEILSSMYDDLKSVKIGLEDSYLVPIMVHSGLKFKNASEFTVLAEQFSFELTTFVATLKKEAGKLPEVMTKKTLPLKAAYVLANLATLESVKTYLADTALILTYSDEMFINKAKTRSFLEGRVDMGEMFKLYYGKTKDMAKEASKLDSVYLDPNGADDVKTMSAVNKLVPTKGFRGNLIYHVMLVFIDKEIKAIETITDKKKLLELRLAKLRLEAEEKGDGSLDKRIEYYEDAISDKEREITKLRKV